jgi:hypothetical protein
MACAVRVSELALKSKGCVARRHTVLRSVQAMTEF